MAFFNLAGHDTELKSATIQIMDQIGYDWWTDTGTEAKDFMQAVRELGDLENVTLEINSPGGNVHEGVSIANFIKGHPANWKALVVGNAASIASVIACACDEVEMGVGTNFLVHKPSSMLFGMVNADQARDLADNLDTIEASITEFYADRLKGKTLEDLEALMREDRYMTADEAIEWGFADSRSVEIQAAACKSTHSLAMQNYFNSEIANRDAEISAMKQKLADLEAENLELKTPTFVSKDTIVKAFQEADLTEHLPQFIDEEFGEATLAYRVETLAELKEFCAVKKLDFQEIAKAVEDPTELVATAINEFEALSEEEIDPSHLGHQETLAEAPSYERAYAQFNTRS